MHRHLLSCVLVLLVGGVGEARAQQTIVFFRHGEKPSTGHGQLTCQGLNRAIALPAVLFGKFGKPQYLYAPNPNVKIPDPSGLSYYDRPLATIEPAAVRLGKDVWTRYGYNDIAGLQGVLITPTKAGTTVFVAWEHIYLQKLVQKIMNTYGGGVSVPLWPESDYDSLYIVRVYYGTTITAQFQRDREWLNGQPTTCPG
jgi:hypothetical protein